MASKVEQWRTFGQKAAQAEAQELELPSGMTILARRPGPAFGAAYAQLPLSLTSAVSTDRPLSVDATKLTDQEQNLAVFLRDLVVYCVVDPVISLTPGPDEMHPRDIPNEDLQFIIDWAGGRSEAERLEAFRPKRSDGSAGTDSSDVRPASISTTEHQGSDPRAELRSGGHGSLGPVEG